VLLRDASDARLQAWLGADRGAVAIAAREAARAPRYAAGRDLVAAADVFAWAEPRLLALPHEELWLLALSPQSRLMSAVRLAQGGDAGLSVGQREVLRRALIEGCAAFVLVHNHPSGDPTPSEADRHFTRAVGHAAAMLGVPMLDHVVVAHGGYRSFLDLGELRTQPDARGIAQRKGALRGRKAPNADGITGSSADARGRLP
jgi:DNA repair protein RadC